MALTTVKGAVLNRGVTVKDFGAVGDGTTDDTAAIQAAIDYTATNGGFIQFGADVYIVTTLTIKSGVILKGAGINATTIKLKDAANVTVVKTLNFDTLTGQNKWLVSDGLQHGFGLMDLQIDGNKANQTTAGIGVEFYGKRIFIKNVLIRDCYGVGWYSEAGDIPGQTDWKDLPESHIDGLWLRNNGSHGMQFRGPHDTYMGSVMSNENGGNGLLIQRSSGVYSGSCDINFAHVYSNTLQGIYADTSAVQFRAQQLISESNYQEGIQITGTKCQISMLQLYNNCRTTGTYDAVFDGTQNTVNDCQIKVGEADGSGMLVTGSSNDITGINCDGQGSTGDGVVVGTGNYINLEGRILDFDGAGATGLKTNDTGASSNCTFTFRISGSSANAFTLWDNLNVGTRNAYNITGVATGASAVAFGGTAGPNATDQNEYWNVALDENGTGKLSKSRKLSTSFTADGAVGSTYTKSIAHNLLTTPEIEDIQLSVQISGGSIGSASSNVVLESVDATNVNVKVRIDAQAAAGKLGYVIMKAEL